MQNENGYNRTIRKDNLDIRMEYMITGMKCVRTRNGNKLVITIDFEGEMGWSIAPKRFDSKAADLLKKLKKIDKGAILKAFEIKSKDNINYLDIDIELSSKH